MKTLITACALALFASCGSSDPKVLTDEGSKALNSGNYAGAARSYEEALEHLGTDVGNPDWKRAKMGLLQAQARLDGAKARTEFLTFAEANPKLVNDGDFQLIASKLGDAEELDEAIAVLEAGKKVYPQSAHLDSLGKDLVKRAKESGDSGALDALKGLGYVGGD